MLMENELPKEDETQEESVVPEENQEQGSATPENSLDSMEGLSEVDNKEGGEKGASELRDIWEERKAKLDQLKDELARELGMNDGREFQSIYDDIKQRKELLEEEGKRRSGTVRLDKVFSKSVLQIYEIGAALEEKSAKIHQEYQEALRELDDKKRQDQREGMMNKIGEI